MVVSMLPSLSYGPIRLIRYFVLITIFCPRVVISMLGHQNFYPLEIFFIILTSSKYKYLVSFGYLLLDVGGGLQPPQNSVHLQID